MRDITNRRARLDLLRAELVAAWTEQNPSVEKIGTIAGQLRATLHEKPDMNQVLSEKVCSPERPTIFIPIYDYLGFNTMDTFPTADAVAAAIVAACKETGGNAEAVVAGEVARGGPYGNVSVSRARAYAALALRAVYEGCAAPVISRLVTAGSPGSYLPSLDHQIKNGRCKWWDDAAFMRVVEAIESHPTKSLAEGKGR